MGETVIGTGGAPVVERPLDPVVDPARTEPPAVPVEADRVSGETVLPAVRTDDGPRSGVTIETGGPAAPVTSFTAPVPASVAARVGADLPDLDPTIVLADVDTISHAIGLARDGVSAEASAAINTLLERLRAGTLDDAGFTELGRLLESALPATEPRLHDATEALARLDAALARYASLRTLAEAVQRDPASDDAARAWAASLLTTVESARRTVAAERSNLAVLLTEATRARDELRTTTASLPTQLREAAAARTAVTAVFERRQALMTELASLGPESPRAAEIARTLADDSDLRTALADVERATTALAESQARLLVIGRNDADAASDIEALHLQDLLTSALDAQSGTMHTCLDAMMALHRADRMAVEAGAAETTSHAATVIEGSRHALDADRSEASIERSERTLRSELTDLRTSLRAMEHALTEARRTVRELEATDPRTVDQEIALARARLTLVGNLPNAAGDGTISLADQVATMRTLATALETRIEELDGRWRRLETALTPFLDPLGLTVDVTDPERVAEVLHQVGDRMGLTAPDLRAGMTYAQIVGAVAAFIGQVQERETYALIAAATYLHRDFELPVRGVTFGADGRITALPTNLTELHAAYLEAINHLSNAAGFEPDTLSILHLEELGRGRPPDDGATSPLVRAIDGYRHARASGLVSPGLIASLESLPLPLTTESMTRLCADPSLSTDARIALHLLLENPELRTAAGGSEITASELNNFRVRLGPFIAYRTEEGTAAFPSGVPVSAFRANGRELANALRRAMSDATGGSMLRLLRWGTSDSTPVSRAEIRWAITEYEAIYGTGSFSRGLGAMEVSPGIRGEIMELVEHGSRSDVAAEATRLTDEWMGAFLVDTGGTTEARRLGETERWIPGRMAVRMLENEREEFDRECEAMRGWFSDEGLWLRVRRSEVDAEIRAARGMVDRVETALRNGDPNARALLAEYAGHIARARAEMTSALTHARYARADSDARDHMIAGVIVTVGVAAAATAATIATGGALAPVGAEATAGALAWAWGAAIIVGTGAGLTAGVVLSTGVEWAQRGDFARALDATSARMPEILTNSFASALTAGIASGLFAAPAIANTLRTAATLSTSARLATQALVSGTVMGVASVGTTLGTAALQRWVLHDTAASDRTLGALPETWLRAFVGGAFLGPLGGRFNGVTGRMVDGATSLVEHAAWQRITGHPITEGLAEAVASGIVIGHVFEAHHLATTRVESHGVGGADVHLRRSGHTREYTIVRIEGEHAVVRRGGRDTRVPISEIMTPEVLSGSLELRERLATDLATREHVMLPLGPDGTFVRCEVLDSNAARGEVTVREPGGERRTVSLESMADTPVITANREALTEGIRGAATDTPPVLSAAEATTRINELTAEPTGRRRTRESAAARELRIRELNHAMDVLEGSLSRETDPARREALQASIERAGSALAATSTPAPPLAMTRRGRTPEQVTEALNTYVDAVAHRLIEMGLSPRRAYEMALERASAHFSSSTRPRGDRGARFDAVLPAVTEHARARVEAALGVRPPPETTPRYRRVAGAEELAHLVGQTVVDRGGTAFRVENRDGALTLVALEGGEVRRVRGPTDVDSWELRVETGERLRPIDDAADLRSRDGRVVIDAGGGSYRVAVRGDEIFLEPMSGGEPRRVRAESDIDAWGLHAPMVDAPEPRVPDLRPVQTIASAGEVPTVDAVNRDFPAVPADLPDSTVLYRWADTEDGVGQGHLSWWTVGAPNEGHMGRYLFRTTLGELRARAGEGGTVRLDTTDAAPGTHIVALHDDISTPVAAERFERIGSTGAGTPVMAGPIPGLEVFTRERPPEGVWLDLDRQPQFPPEPPQTVTLAPSATRTRAIEIVLDRARTSGANVRTLWHGTEIIITPADTPAALVERFTAAERAAAPTDLGYTVDTHGALVFPETTTRGARIETLIARARETDAPQHTTVNGTEITIDPRDTPARARERFEAAEHPNPGEPRVRDDGTIIFPPGTSRTRAIEFLLARARETGQPQRATWAGGSEVTVLPTDVPSRVVDTFDAAEAAGVRYDVGTDGALVFPEGTSREDAARVLAYEAERSGVAQRTTVGGVEITARRGDTAAAILERVAVGTSDTLPPPPPSEPPAPPEPPRLPEPTTPEAAIAALGFNPPGPIRRALRWFFPEAAHVSTLRAGSAVELVTGSTRQRWEVARVDWATNEIVLRRDGVELSVSASEILSVSTRGTPAITLRTNPDPGAVVRIPDGTRAALDGFRVRAFREGGQVEVYRITPDGTIETRAVTLADLVRSNPEAIVGREIAVGDRRYVVESVADGRVSMREATGTGTRAMPIADFVRDHGPAIRASFETSTPTPRTAALAAEARALAADDSAVNRRAMLRRRATEAGLPETTFDALSSVPREQLEALFLSEPPIDWSGIVGRLRQREVTNLGTLEAILDADPAGFLRLARDNPVLLGDLASFDRYFGESSLRMAEVYGLDAVSRLARMYALSPDATRAYFAMHGRDHAMTEILRDFSGAASEAYAALAEFRSRPHGDDALALFNEYFAETRDMHTRGIVETEEPGFLLEGLRRALEGGVDVATLRRSISETRPRDPTTIGIEPTTITGTEAPRAGPRGVASDVIRVRTSDGRDLYLKPFGGRNGTRPMNELLAGMLGDTMGLGLVPHAELVMYNGQLCVAMEALPSGMTPAGYMGDALTRPDAANALSDMRAFDYLLAVGDRHGTNMYYGTSEDGTPRVMSIDNDSSFLSMVAPSVRSMWASGGMLPESYTPRFREAFSRLSPESLRERFAGVMSEDQIAGLLVRYETMRAHILEVHGPDALTFTPRGSGPPPPVSRDAITPPPPPEDTPRVETAPPPPDPPREPPPVDASRDALPPAHVNTVNAAAEASAPIVVAEDPAAATALLSGPGRARGTLRIGGEDLTVTALPEGTTPADAAAEIARARQLATFRVGRPPHPVAGEIVGVVDLGNGRVGYATRPLEGSAPDRVSDRITDRTLRELGDLYRALEAAGLEAQDLSLLVSADGRLSIGDVRGIVPRGSAEAPVTLVAAAEELHAASYGRDVLGQRGTPMSTTDLRAAIERGDLGTLSTEQRAGLLAQLDDLPLDASLFLRRGDDGTFSIFDAVPTGDGWQWTGRSIGADGTRTTRLTERFDGTGTRAAVVTGGSSGGPIADVRTTLPAMPAAPAPAALPSGIRERALSIGRRIGNITSDGLQPKDLAGVGGERGGRRIHDIADGAPYDRLEEMSRNLHGLERHISAIDGFLRRTDLSAEARTYLTALRARAAAAAEIMTRALGPDRRPVS